MQPKGHMLIWKAKVLILGMGGGGRVEGKDTGLQVFWGGEDFLKISEVQVSAPIQDFAWSFLFEKCQHLHKLSAGIQCWGMHPQHF